MGPVLVGEGGGGGGGEWAWRGVSSLVFILHEDTRRDNPRLLHEDSQ